MRYSVCIIDDKIPASEVEGIQDTGLLNASNLQLLLKQGTWTDGVIKNLTQTLLEERDIDGVTPKWDVSGFTNPFFLKNRLDTGLERFDIVVFDWEYPGTGSGAGTDSGTILKEILEKTFCLVFVFSGAEKESEIKTVLSGADFLEYKQRIEYLNKSVSGADQSNALLKKAQEMYASNFSFNFAGELRKKAVQTMDRILSDLGRVTLSDLKNYLNLEEAGTKRDLVDFIAERFRCTMVVSDLPEIVDNGCTSASAVDTGLIKKIWSYRLYQPVDGTISAGEELVRRGDVIRQSEEYFLVISSDCDLKRFWHKNFGSIGLLPLHFLHSSNDRLRDILTFCVSPGKLKEGEFRHLTDTIGGLSEGPFILPFVKIDGDYKHFIGMPKDILGRRIEIHADVSALSKEKRKASYLRYAWWIGATKVCSVSEPFLTGITEHVFKAISGYGVPDYPSPMKTMFQAILNEFTTFDSPPTSEPAKTHTPR